MLDQTVVLKVNFDSTISIARNPNGFDILGIFEYVMNILCAISRVLCSILHGIIFGNKIVQFLFENYYLWIIALSDKSTYFDFRI